MFVFVGQGSFTIAGKVESGSIENGDRITVMPAGEGGNIKGNFKISNNTYGLSENHLFDTFI